MTCKSEGEGVKRSASSESVLSPNLESIQPGTGSSRPIRRRRTKRRPILAILQGRGEKHEPPDLALESSWFSGQSGLRVRPSGKRPVAIDLERKSLRKSKGAVRVD